MRFVIYHQAPGGPKMYHCDSGCTISENRKDAKVYGTLKRMTEEDVAKQLDVVRKNFEYVFSDAGKSESSAHADYKTAEHWMGNGLEGIETKTEEL